MLTKRLLTVAIAAPFLIGAIVAPYFFVFKLFVIVCMLIAFNEFYTIVGHPKGEKEFAIALGTAHVSYLLFSPMGLGGFEMALIPIVTFVFYCLYPLTKRDGIAPRIALTVLGTFYIGTSGSFVALLRTLPYGVFWVFALLGMTWMNDTAAYFFGHRFGGPKLAPKISPGKTWAGFFGGFVGSFCGFLMFWFLLPNETTLWQGVMMVACVGVIGPIGDLSESLIKRSFGVKDSGDVIPGHGGMLDRIDALLFTAPLVYWFAISQL